MAEMNRYTFQIPRLSLLNGVIVGHSDRDEFTPAYETLRDRTDLIALERLEMLEEMLRKNEELPKIDLIVLCQSYPGEFSETVLNRIKAALPLCPIISLAGAWCEGEARTGRSLPGTVRMYANQWEARSGREISAMENRLLCRWTLPATCSEEERYLFHPSEPEKTRENDLASIFVAILDCPESPGYDPEMNRLLREIFVHAGYFSDVLPRERFYPKPSVIVWDIGIALKTERSLDVIRSLREEYPDIEIAILGGSFRADERKSISAAGADRIVSKPFDISDLIS